ncbi:glycosyltransferase [Rubinisphaera italica]|uniref:Glycosyltransferase sugar-binding region containing DXD motif protein n=1 Tax=Rubinisphaera italica TaxID=2527969 RepID=A0A5C5XGB0_9PLAN|nr:glycosyltransferase [Rubinisphaera italica]TWT61709.1 Glycosyltransferase sugar-binding region containing DXD motif protein [Rubinisphaera italica]
MLYIVGCGRSGTKYTATFLNKIGIQVKHEEPGPDGEVGWKGLLKILDGEIDPSSHIVLHQVRNPLETISSMRTHSHGLLGDVSRHFSTNSSLKSATGKLHRCMEFWYEWNLLAENYSKWTYQTESFTESIDRICDLIDHPRVEGELPLVDPNLNSRRIKRFARFQEEPVSWEKLSSIDAGLVKRIRQLAQKYGYGDRYLSDDFKIDPVSVDDRPRKQIKIQKPTDEQTPQKIFIAPYLLDMPQVSSITRSICDGKVFFPSENSPSEDRSWTLAWGYPANKRRFGIAETGFFWDGMHIDTRGLYQFSSLNTAEGLREILDFSPPESARQLINRSSLPRSKYRQAQDEMEWDGVVFACQNPADRSIHSVASTGDWWRFLEDSCRYYGSKLFIKLHPWNRNEIEARIREIGTTYGCQVGRVGHSILSKCEHVVLFNSTFSVDCMLNETPVKQGAPGYFSGTSAVSYCELDPRKPLIDTKHCAEQLLNFLVWRYCFSMDCSLDDWKERLLHFANSTDLFPLTIQQSYGNYLMEKAGSKPDIVTNPIAKYPPGNSVSDIFPIPKVFHLIWLGDNKIPDDQRAWIDQWQELHPEWETRHWGNEVVDELSVELRVMFEQANSWSGKSDIARVALVHKYGGVYRDTDYRPLRCINSILQGCHAFAMTERPNGRLTGSLFGAIPNHPFLRDIINEMPNRFHPEKPMNTGPLLFDAVFKKGRGDVRLFEREVFAPVMSKRKQHARSGHFPNSFAVHTYAGSWTKKSANVNEEIEL